MNNPLVVESSVNPRHVVKIKTIHCFQTEDISDGDEIYLVYEFANGVDGRRPSQGNKYLNDGDNWNLNFKMSFHGGVLIRLYDYDRDSRDDPFDNVTLSESSNDSGGPFLRLPVSEARDWEATVKQRQDFQRGRYKYFFRVLPPQAHFLSSLRQAAFYLENLRDIASLPSMDKITDNFTEALFQEIFTTVVAGARIRIASNSVSISEAARVYGCLNACRLQMERSNGPNPSQGVQLAENYSLNLIRSGIESEVALAAQMLAWQIDDDITDQ